MEKLPNKTDRVVALLSLIAFSGGEDRPDHTILKALLNEALNPDCPNHLGEPIDARLIINSLKAIIGLRVTIDEDLMMSLTETTDLLVSALAISPNFSVREVFYLLKELKDQEWHRVQSILESQLALHMSLNILGACALRSGKAAESFAEAPDERDLPPTGLLISALAILDTLTSRLHLAGINVLTTYRAEVLNAFRVILGLFNWNQINVGTFLNLLRHLYGFLPPLGDKVLYDLEYQQELLKTLRQLFRDLDIQEGSDPRFSMSSLDLIQTLYTISEISHKVGIPGNVAYKALDSLTNLIGSKEPEEILVHPNCFLATFFNLSMLISSSNENNVHAGGLILTACLALFDKLGLKNFRFMRTRPRLGELRRLGMMVFNLSRYGLHYLLHPVLSAVAADIARHSKSIIREIEQQNDRETLAFVFLALSYLSNSTKLENSDNPDHQPLEVIQNLLKVAYNRLPQTRRDPKVEKRVRSIIEIGVLEAGPSLLLDILVSTPAILLKHPNTNRILDSYSDISADPDYRVLDALEMTTNEWRQIQLYRASLNLSYFERLLNSRTGFEFGDYVDILLNYLALFWHCAVRDYWHDEELKVKLRKVLKEMSSLASKCHGSLSKSNALALLKLLQILQYEDLSEESQIFLEFVQSSFDFEFFIVELIERLANPARSQNAVITAIRFVRYAYISGLANHLENNSQFQHLVGLVDKEKGKPTYQSRDSLGQIQEFLNKSRSDRTRIYEVFGGEHIYGIECDLLIHYRDPRTNSGLPVINLEIDGPCHDDEIKKMSDRIRDTFLCKRGVTVLRIPIKENVMDYLDEINKILRDKEQEIKNTGATEGQGFYSDRLN